MHHRAGVVVPYLQDLLAIRVQPDGRIPPVTKGTRMVGCVGMNTPDYRKNMITAMELHETGKALMYQKIVRENPDASAEAIDEMWCDWLFRRKDAIPGDVVSGPVRIRSAS